MKHKRDQLKGLAPKGLYVSPHISYATAKIDGADRDPHDLLPLKPIELLVLTMLSAGVAYATVEGAVDDDPANQLWDCASRHVPLGNADVDVLRCLTFNFSAPKNVRRAPCRHRQAGGGVVPWFRCQEKYLIKYNFNSLKYFYIFSLSISIKK